LVDSNGQCTQEKKKQSTLQTPAVGKRMLQKFRECGMANQSVKKKEIPGNFFFLSYALTENKQKPNLIYPIELFDRKIRLRNIARRKRQ